MIQILTRTFFTFDTTVKIILSCKANNIKIDPTEINQATDLNGSHKRKKNTSIYHCNYCTEIFPSKKFLAVHKKELHANEERVKCDDCGKMFKDEIRLQKHSDSSHKQNKIICKLCMNYYKSQACLKAHVRGKHETNGEKVIHLFIVSTVSIETEDTML